MTKTGVEPRKRISAPSCRNLSFLTIAAAVISVTAAARTAAAQMKNCGASVGLWPDGAPQCLNDHDTLGDPTAACCCRRSPPETDPEVWTGACTLRKGGLLVLTTGLRLDYFDGRRELVQGVANVSVDPAWQAGPIVGSFKLEILGGAELTTEGNASAELALDGSRVSLRADTGRAVLTHRLNTVNLVVEPGQAVSLDPAKPETWVNAQVYGHAGARCPDQVSGCSAQPRPFGGPSAILVLLCALIAWLARAKRLRPGRG